jgi:hypothetical protein
VKFARPAAVNVAAISSCPTPSIFRSLAGSICLRSQYSRRGERAQRVILQRLGRRSPPAPIPHA